MADILLLMDGDRSFYQKLSCVTDILMWLPERYVGEEDMNFFKERLEEPKGAGPWEHMMAKDFNTFTYEAWRRTLAVCPLLLDYASPVFHTCGSKCWAVNLVLLGIKSCVWWWAP